MPRTTEDFFASRIQTWYREKHKAWNRTHKKPRQFYVLKSYSGEKKLNNIGTLTNPEMVSEKVRLSPKEIVKEHVGSTLYRLLGVRTPLTQIVIEHHNGNPEYSLISEYINGYKDLSKLLADPKLDKETNFLNQLDDLETQTDRNLLLSKRLKEKNLLFAKECLLVAAILLMESDLLGWGLSNLGAVSDPITSVYTLVKIDPGAIDTSSPLSHFTDNISRDHKLLLKDFSSPVYNDPKKVGVNLHLLEFFNDVREEEVNNAVLALHALTDDEIKRHILREDYYNLVEPAYLENICSTILERKNALLALYPSPVKVIKEIRQPLLPIFSERTSYSESVHTIERGNSTPIIVYKKEDEVSSSLQVSLV